MTPFQEKAILYLEENGNVIPALNSVDFLRAFTREDATDRERMAYANMFMAGALKVAAEALDGDTRPSEVHTAIYFLSKTYKDLNDIYMTTRAN